MAASVPQAFGDEALWFALPYLVIRGLGIGLQVRVDRERSLDELGISMTWVYVSMVGLAVVLGGAFVDTSGPHLDLVAGHRHRSHGGRVGQPERRVGPQPEPLQ